jgi:tetratricopeptide (TPR) repeat protein
LVARNDPKAIEPGSIADTVARLAVWAGRPTRALARVEYHSEYTRAEAARRLSDIAHRGNIPYNEIELPIRHSPSEILGTILERLASLEPGIVSITGFATACPEESRAEFLGALTFNRENLTEFSHRQIWWLTPDFANAFIHTLPDLDSWFDLRLQLRETFPSPTKGAPRREPSHAKGPSHRLEDALRRARSLVARFRRAKEFGASTSELIELAARAADAIDEVGVPHRSKVLADQLLAEANALLPDPSFDTDSALRLFNSLANLLVAQGRLAEAKPLVDRALALVNGRDGHDEPNVARDLNNLATLLTATNRLAEAEPLYRRALAIDEAFLGPDHPLVATDLNNLALLLKATNRMTEAEPLYRGAVRLAERSLGQEHPQVATTLKNLGLLLEGTNRLSEAEPLYRRALAIDEAAYGPDHPEVATDLKNLGVLLQATNRRTEAEPLFRRALAISEATLGTNHPSVAFRLNNLAELLRATNRLNEAEPLYRRALAIDEASYGPDHLAVATDLNNVATLLHDTNRGTEAEPLYRRALEILLLANRVTGHEHSHQEIVTNNYAGLLAAMGQNSEQVRARLDEIGRPFGMSLGG